MEKREAEAEVEEQTRIFVGGLGEKVTDDDLSKIFSSLGEVKAVDIVRTKGRSFGYVDFFPSSHKSLSKLFSTYNGCVWKGGRLRLERAKEHYLARLKREWAEDDAQLVDPPVTDSVAADNKDATRLDMPKKLLDKDKKLKVFFPRLRKVKTLPFSGTGKHKYSFQRVEAPPLPKYFCDCEEHSTTFHAAEWTQVQHPAAAGKEEIHDMEALGVGLINEEELNLMNSVMNKLFVKQNFSNAGLSGTGLTNDERNSDSLIGDLQISENEVDSVADEDNLVVNVVSRGNNIMALPRCQEKTTVSPTNKKLTLSEARISKDRSAQSSPKEQKKNNLPTNKKRKSLHNYETMMAANPLDNMDMQTNMNKPSMPLAAQHAETDSGVKKSTASHSWSQKMSWKALVGDKDSRTFSVSNILPFDAYPEEADNAIDSFEELNFDENESDEDNLMINVVSKKKPKMDLSSSQKWEATSTMYRKSVSNEDNTTTKDRPIQQEKSSLPSKKKRKSVINEESDKNKSVHTVPKTNGCAQTYTESQMPVGPQLVKPESVAKQSISNHSDSKKPSQRVVIGKRGDDESSVSNVLPDNSAREEEPVSDCPDVSLGSTDDKNQNSLARNENLERKLAETESVEVLAEAQPFESNTAPNKSGKGSSWFQKSPWTQLVNENNSSFSITQILPGISFKDHEVPKTQVGKEVANPNDKKSSKSVSQAGITCASAALEDRKKGEIVSKIIPEKNPVTVVGNNEASASIVADKLDSTPRQTTNVDGAIGETCSFMRSAASIKEWSTAKAALSGSQSHKRKSHK